MAGTDPLPKEIDEMIRVWADHSTIPFQGKGRSEVIDKALRLTISMAFSTVEKAIPQLKGARFAYVWDEKNHISVAVAPKDELTKDMLIIKIGEKIETEEPDANRVN